MKKIFIVVLLMFVIIASFLLGGKVSKEGIETSVNQIQAELNFGHLKVYTDLRKDLLLNCRSRAESRLDFIINQQKMLIASYVQQDNQEEFESYINLRDKDLIIELRTYEVNWNKEWVLPKC